MRVSLPEELVSEILRRLPAKSLMRFKSVERSWNTLFKTNSFITRQREWRMASSDEERLMMFHSDQVIVTTLMTLISYNQRRLQDLQYPVPHPDHYFIGLHSFGHCNGIFCLRGSFIANSRDQDFEETILWNPATREFKVLPSNPLTPPSLNFNYFGFGASDPDAFDHFNFIQIYVDDTLVVYVEVYNINTDSWTIIHDFDADGVINLNSYGSNDREAYSNGVYHWLSADFTYILYFDFHRNKFRKINTPSAASRNTILEAHDCIAYLVYEFDVRIEIWNLKQDSTWVKLCNFVPLDSNIRDFTIRAIWKDGTEFLGGSDYDWDVLTSYNSRAQPLRQLETFAADIEYYIYRYVESIAPLSL